MRKLFLTAIVFICYNASFGQTKNYVAFQAEIANRNNDFIDITLLNGQLVKKILLNKNGFFKDTLNVKSGMYRMKDGIEMTELYLENGYDLKLKMDAKQFDESMIYTGKGATENNFLVKRILENEKYYNQNYIELNEADFAKSLDDKKKDDVARVNNKKLNPNFILHEKKTSENSLLLFQQKYSREKARKELNDKLNNTISPSFDYVNHKGGKSKLEDYKGKYVYIDIWATWCGPCRVEIPFLQKIEEEYHDKNIIFVSISIDVTKDFEKWKAFVTTKNLDGVQLFADKDWNSDFLLSYGVNGIPRFILIDPTGKIVNGNAPRPSDPELGKLLSQLLK